MIFITGGTGLLGCQFLWDLCQKNSGIRALKRPHSSIKEVESFFKLQSDDYQDYFNKIQWVDGDISDIYSLENYLDDVTEIYHLAAKVSFNEKHEQKLWQSNVQGTKNMVDLAIEKKVEKFCYVSSIAVLDTKNENNTLDENSEFDIQKEHSSYAITKYAAEMEVWRGSEEGLNMVVVLPGIIIGSGNWDRSGVLFNMTYSKFPVATKGKSGFVDARDVAKISIELMNQNIFNQRFILVADNQSYDKVLDRLKNLFNKKKLYIVPNFGLLIGHKISSILSLLSKRLHFLNKANYEALTSQMEYDNQKIHQYLPDFQWTPIEKSLKEHGENYLNYKLYENSI